MSRSATRVNRRCFTVRVESETARDDEMSYKALGLLTHILSHAEDWVVRSEQLSRPKKREGRDSVRTGLHELAARGYYRLERRRFLDGTVVMGTAVSEFSVEQWAKDYVTFGGKLDVHLVEQEDGSFLVRYPDGTLGSDGFVPVPAVKDVGVEPEVVEPVAAAAAEEAATPAPAQPPAKRRAGRAGRAVAAKKVTAEEKAEADKVFDAISEEVAKKWWEHAKTHMGPYVGQKNAYIALRKQIRSALVAGYTRRDVGQALLHAKKHWPSAQQWQEALGVVTNHIQPNQRNGRVAYSDSTTWGTPDPGPSSASTDTPDDDVTFGVIAD
ncbi:hypothetical protein [Streptomyces sp. NPDC046685]|uniref:hypothetical protein n=1 Tax=Streptomyces sp. NPDC046685 TaxID=3157202 RepID=UPI0033C489AC